MKKRLSRQVIVDLIAILEAALVFSGALMAKLFYVDLVLSGAEPNLSYLGVGLVGALQSYLIMRQLGHYEPDRIVSMPMKSNLIFLSLGLTFLILIAAGYLLKVGEDYSRGWILSWFALSFIFLLLSRRVTVDGLRSLSSKGLFNQRVVIIGVEPLCSRLQQHIAVKGIEAELVGVFSVPGITNRGEVMNRVLTDKLRDLVAFVKTVRVDRIVVALPEYGGARVQEILLELGQLSVEIDFCLGEAALDLKRPGISYLGSLGLYNMQRSPISAWGVFAKRALDLLVVVPALILFAVPMAIVAVLIRLTSPGRILFVQERNGLNGNVIHVMKFRTMIDRKREDKVHQVKKGDSEVTWIGAYLRRWSIDELPQLFNVLKGDMSIVGSRPHPVKLDEKFADVVQLNKEFNRLERYAARYKLKPGITGWAQVNGARGETDTREKMEKRVGYDLFYINNWSILFDITIVLMTVTAVLKGDNAH